MVLMLRILAALTALSGIGAIMVILGGEQNGAGPLVIAGRALNESFPSLTLALVTYVVADLLAAKKLKDIKKD